MRDLPLPGSYIAFSLREAQHLISTLSTQDGDFRRIFPEVFLLGGINQPLGIVLDEEHGDVILVGRYDPARQPMTLDDLVVALRARLRFATWPLVSLDADLSSPKKPQTVRFEGGIEDTQFGADLLEADYRLKELSFGILASGVPAVVRDPYRSRVPGHAQQFWFFPLIASTAVRDGVAAIWKVKIGVFTKGANAGEMHATIASNFRDSAAEEFAASITENFPLLALQHSFFSRLQILTELVALSKAVESFPKLPDLSFWLHDYRVRRVPTPSSITVLWRKVPFRRVTGENQQNYYERVFLMYGGARLEALALQIRSEDAIALRKGVLSTRPGLTTLSWHFLVGDWITPLLDGTLAQEDAKWLVQQAEILSYAEDSSAAIPFYSALIELQPSNAEAYLKRGQIYSRFGHSALALQDFEQAIAHGVSDPEVNIARGVVLARLGRYHDAIREYSIALERERNPFVLFFRAFSFFYAHAPTEALSDLEMAITIQNDVSEFHMLKGYILFCKGNLAQAQAEYEKATNIWSENSLAFLMLATTYDLRQRKEDAITAYELYLRHGKPTSVKRTYSFRGQHFVLLTGSVGNFEIQMIEERIREVRQGIFLLSLDPCCC